MPRRLALLLAVPLGGLGLAACTATLASDDVATQAENALEEQIGARPDIVCPEDLDGGGRCGDPLHADRRRRSHGVRRDGHGDRGRTGPSAQFDVEVDDQPQG